MREVLVIGSGAREHALVLNASKKAHVYCAPGNPGIAEIAECVPIPADNIKELLRFAQDHHPDLTIVGPEVPLALGVVNLFLESELAIFGPTQQAAQLESSKYFAKRLMEKYKISVARSKYFKPTDWAKVMPYLDSQQFPIVIKDDGLAAGKGVQILNNFGQAFDLSSALLTSGKSIIIEEFLEGDEVSVSAICKDRDYIPMLVTQDHKQAYKGGPNTGGMGVYTPVPFVDKNLEDFLYQNITRPTLNGLADKDINFTGFLYTNLMLTKKGPYVLEHNTRLGDPETQAMLPLMRNDFIDLLINVLSGEIRDIRLNWLDKYAVSLTLASYGYPNSYETGKVIEGIGDAQKIPDVLVMHAGTKIQDGKLVTAGGRVLSVVALADSLEEAVKKVYFGASKINFDGMYYRNDIGERSLDNFPI